MGRHCGRRRRPRVRQGTGGRDRLGGLRSFWQLRDRHRWRARARARLVESPAGPDERRIHMSTRHPNLLSIDELTTLIEDGAVDTVIVAFTDMQGRLQGKRLHAQYFLDVVVDHGTEGCNYL